MARATIDASAIGEGWFKNITADLMKLKGVEFVHSLDDKAQGEVERAKKIGQFYLTASKLGRKVITVSAEDANRHIAFLENVEEWKSRTACDDPHIFAIVFEKNVKYVFTGEQRLAECRDCINKKVDNRYCGFSLIRSEEIYNEHRQAIGK